MFPQQDDLAANQRTLGGIGTRAALVAQFLAEKLGKEPLGVKA